MEQPNCSQQILVSGHHGMLKKYRYCIVKALSFLLAQQSRSQMTWHLHRPNSLHQHRATMVKGNTHLFELVTFEIDIISHYRRLTTVRVDSLPHRKWKKTKQQRNMLPGPAVPGCCLVSFHFLWGKLSTRTLHDIFLKLALHTHN